MNATRTQSYPAYQRGQVLALKDAHGGFYAAEVVKVKNGCQGGCWQYMLRNTRTDFTEWYDEEDVKGMVYRRM